MSDTAELDAFIDAGAKLLGIPIAPEWRAAIRTHLEISLALAHGLTGFALPDEADPAPVFKA